MKRGESKIPRMEDILNLPVQDPSCSEFSAVNLNWMKVDGGRHGSDDIALIPYARVDDFVKGESSNAECPATFRIESRRKRSEGSISKPRVDGYLEYTLYWCSYGPEDYRCPEFRSGDCTTNKPSSGKGSRPGRRHMMRGCLCHFTVKRLYSRPLLALIVYNQRSHVDKNGMPCHGLLDRDALGTRAVYAPRISEELRQKIMSMLYVGIPLDNIIQHHMKVVEKHGGPTNRDDFLTKNDVRNMERAIHSAFELHDDDARSVKLWVQRHKKYVFFFQENREMDPFILGIQTEWQLQRMLQYGHNSSVVSHSNFGSKKLRYPLHTLLVFDSCQNAIPIAWVITANFCGHDAPSWMAALVARARMKDQSWRPNAFLVDDPRLDISLTRKTFQCQVLFCLWHVRRAWLKSLLKKCLNFDVQKEMFKQLGSMLYCTKSGLNIVNAVEEFMQIFVDQHAFMEYLKRRWSAQIDMWVSVMRTLPVSRQELNGAIESYHLKLKSTLFSHSNAGSWDRVDWLVHRLTAEFHSIYWFYKYSEDYHVFRSYIEEFFPSNSWYRAMHIPDLDVVLDEEHLNFAKVVSQSDRSRAYTVWNPGSEFCLCDCPWSKVGNFCKHVIKVNNLFSSRQLARPSLASHIYRQTLTNLLHNPSVGPLVLDCTLHVSCTHHDLEGLEDLPHDGLLQPSSTVVTNVLSGDSVFPQTHMAERDMQPKRKRARSSGLSNGGFQLDFPGQATLLENLQTPSSSQMGELLDSF